MGKGIGIQASYFHRDAQNIIDWTRAVGETAWQVQNIADSKTHGIELGMDMFPGVFSHRFHRTNFKLSYVYLDSQYDSGKLESKYVMDQLRHQFNGAVFIDWLDRLNQSINLRYEKRMNGNSQVIVDTRMAYRQRAFELFVDAVNLTHETYVDNGFAPAPGRSVYIGIRFNKNIF